MKILTMTWQFSINACELLWWEHTLLVVVPFLIGLLMGWLLWGRLKKKVSNLENELSAIEKVKSNLAAEVEFLTDQSERQLSRIAETETALDASSRKLRKVQNQHSELRREFKDLDQRQQNFEHDRLAMQSSLDQLSSARDEREGTISTLQAELTDLESKLSEQEKMNTNLRKQLNEVDASRDTGKEEISDLQKLLATTQEARLHLEERVRSLEADLAAGKVRTSETKQPVIDNGHSSDTNDQEKPHMHVALEDGTAQDTSGQILSSGMGAGVPVSGSTDLDQARQILGRKFQEDDLRIVEGIGPKIAALLQNEGIDTWLALSGTTVQRLRSILDDAGPSFRPANPSTWPEQARLAAHGLWDDLKKMQDEI